MLSWKLPFMQSQGKRSNKSNSLMSCKRFEEEVIVSNELVILPPSFSCPSLLRVHCSLSYCGFMGNLSSNAVSHEVIFLGRGRILKWFGICDLQKVQKMFVRSSSLLLLSLERASATSLRSPLNHWLYDLSPSNMKRLACFWAASIQTNDWSLLSPCLLKLNFQSQPSAAVLSVIDRMQSCGFKHPSIMSIHGEIIAARCFNKLFDALNFKGSGMYERKAKPSLLYTPSPAGQESER